MNVKYIFIYNLTELYYPVLFDNIAVPAKNTPNSWEQLWKNS